MLNRIRYFVSADIGIGEYMQKNFEAMAAGCVVFAFDQGTLENKALGLVDMENIVLYQDKQTLISKIQYLRSNKNLADKISENGRRFAQVNYSNFSIGKVLYMAVKQKLRTKQKKSIFDFLRF